MSPFQPELDSAPPHSIHVVAGVLYDSAGRVLVNQRLARQPMPGKWEFPGGKLEPGEARQAGLARELEEELGVSLLSARPLIRFRHAGAELDVVLDIWQVEEFAGQPRGRLGQALRWVAVDELSDLDLLDANRPIVRAVGLPALYLVTGPGEPRQFFARLDVALRRGIRLVQLRAPTLDDGAFRALAAQAAERCRQSGARLLLNGEPGAAAGLARELQADGIHVPARYLGALRPGAAAGLLIGASCHDAVELAAAAQAGADFAVLGPVRRTSSHAGRAPLGWRRFDILVAETGLPVYALGGLGEDDLPRAWAAGAQGVAAIRALWAPPAGRD